MKLSHYVLLSLFFSIPSDDAWAQRYPTPVPKSRAPNSSGSMNYQQFKFGNTFRPSPFQTQPNYGSPNRSYFRDSSGQRDYVQNGTRYYMNSGSSSRYASNNSRSISPSAPPRITYSGDPIKIYCPESESSRCNYELIGASGKTYDYLIRGGQSQSFNETTSWKIRYDQGQGRGYKTYRLTGGHEYSLRRTSGGYWQLYDRS